MGQFFQTSLRIHLVLQGNCKAFVVICKRGTLRRAWQCVLPLPWLVSWLPFTHTFSLQKPTLWRLLELTSCSIVNQSWLRSSEQSVATLDHGYTYFFFSAAFLFHILSQHMQGSIGEVAVFVTKEAAFFSSDFPAM